MTERERDEALELLQDPQLLERILADYDACGLVGEETNKLVCYLACVSRHLPRPLSVLVQSSSAAGKTSLLEATLAFMPAEAQIRLSALTGQSLYYMGRTELKHKILAVAEEEGVAEAELRAEAAAERRTLDHRHGGQGQRHGPPTDPALRSGRPGGHAADHHGRRAGCGTGQPLPHALGQRTARSRRPPFTGGSGRPTRSQANKTGRSGRAHAAPACAAAAGAAGRGDSLGRAADLSHRPDARCGATMPSTWR